MEYSDKVIKSNPWLRRRMDSVICTLIGIGLIFLLLRLIVPSSQ